MMNQKLQDAKTQFSDSAEEPAIVSSREEAARLGCTLAVWQVNGLGGEVDFLGLHNNCHPQFTQLLRDFCQRCFATRKRCKAALSELCWQSFFAEGVTLVQAAADGRPVWCDIGGDVSLIARHYRGKSEQTICVANFVHVNTSLASEVFSAIGQNRLPRPVVPGRDLLVLGETRDLDQPRPTIIKIVRRY